MKKKIITALLALVLMLAVIPTMTACSNRDRILFINSWAYFIDHSILADFETWYYEETGNRVEIRVIYFGSNEEVLRNLQRGDDFDLVNPSDYMIQRLIAANMVQELDQEVRDRFIEVGSPMLRDLTTIYDPQGRFSVPYIWGTFGIMYDARRINDEIGNRQYLNSWSALFPQEGRTTGFSQEQFYRQVTMKASIRDTYAATLLHLYSDQLLAYLDAGNSAGHRALLEDLFQNFSNDVMGGTASNPAQKGNGRFARVRAELERQFNMIHSYEIDAGKSVMMRGNAADPALGLYWSVDAGYIMGNYRGSTDGTALGYIIPDEGTNVWVDAWIIPKNARNTSAANAFIYFSMKPEIAMRNSRFAGGQSSNAQAMVQLREEFEADTAFFANATNEHFRAEFFEAVFPSDETLARAAVMGDPGAWLVALSTMFDQVMGG